jgi:hypothetical protein
MGPKTFHSKSIYKRRHQTREDFSRKRKVHAFRGDLALEKLPWKFPRRKEKFGSRPRAIKGKTFPKSHTINGPSGLLTDIIHPCLHHHPTADSSRLQLPPLAPELLHTAAAFLNSAESAAATAAILQLPSPPHSKNRRRQPPSTWDAAAPLLCLPFPPQPMQVPPLSMFRTQHTPPSVRSTSPPPPSYLP